MMILGFAVMCAYKCSSIAYKYKHKWLQLHAMSMFAQSDGQQHQYAPTKQKKLSALSRETEQSKLQLHQMSGAA